NQLMNYSYNPFHLIPRDTATLHTRTVLSISIHNTAGKARGGRVVGATAGRDVSAANIAGAYAKDVKLQLPGDRDTKIAGGSRGGRSGRQNDLQSCGESRRTVLHLAGAQGERAGLEGRRQNRHKGRVPGLHQGSVDRHAAAEPAKEN